MMAYGQNNVFGPLFEFSSLKSYTTPRPEIYISYLHSVVMVGEHVTHMYTVNRKAVFKKNLFLTSVFESFCI